MHNKLTKGWGLWATRALVALVLVAVVFSPLQGIVQAQVGDPSAPTTPIQQANATAARNDAKDNASVAPPTTPIRTGSDQTLPSCKFDVATWDLCITNIVYVFTVGMMSAFAYMGSYVFNIAIQLTLASTSYSLSFLSVGWAAMRDVANMAFIFILIYIAVTIILGADTSGTIKTLAVVIVMALLINFSFFITRVVIDAGNYLAVQMYNAIPIKQTVAQTAATSGYISTGTAAIGTNLVTPGNSPKDLTWNIMQVTKIQNLFSNPSFIAFYNGNGGTQKSANFLVVVITLSFLYIAIGAMFAILAATFFTVGFKFLYRLIMLWFVIIFAPAAFIARALPGKKLGSWYASWQSNLFQQSIFPAFFLFVFIIINYFMVEMATAGGTNGLVGSIFNSINNTTVTDASNSGFLWAIGVSVANIFIRLGLVVFMMWVGLKLSDAVAAQGNAAAKNFSGWMGRRLGAATLGTGGWLGRNTVGWGAQKVFDSGRVTAAASKVPFLRPLRNVAGKLGGASFDARGIKNLKTGVGYTGIDIGTGRGVGGYKKNFDDRVAYRVAQSEKFKLSESAVIKRERRVLEEEIKKLNPEEKAAYQKAASEYKAAHEENKELNSSESRKILKEKKAAFEGVKNAEGKNIAKEIADKIKKATGESNKGNYANSIDKRSWSTLGRLGRNIAFITAADKEAARRIRGTKDASVRVLDLITKGYEAPPKAATETRTDSASTETAKSTSEGSKGSGKSSEAPPESKAKHTQPQPNVFGVDPTQRNRNSGPRGRAFAPTRTIATPTTSQQEKPEVSEVIYNTQRLNRTPEPETARTVSTPPPTPIPTPTPTSAPQTPATPKTSLWSLPKEPPTVSLDATSMNLLSRIARGTEKVSEVGKQQIKGTKGLLSAIEKMKPGQPTQTVVNNQNLHTSTPQTPTPVEIPTLRPENITLTEPVDKKTVGEIETKPEQKPEGTV